MTAIDNIVNNKTTTIVTESHVLQGHQGVIHAVQFNHDGTQLASASDDRSIRLWGQQRRQQQQQQQEEENNDNHPNASVWTLQWVAWGHTARCWNVTFCNNYRHPDDDDDDDDDGRNCLLASSGEDGTIRLWSDENGEPVATLQGSGSYWDVDYCSTSGMLAGGGNDGTVHLYHLASRLPYDGGATTCRRRRRRCRTIVAVPDDRRVPSNEQPTASSSSAIEDKEDSSKPTKTKKTKKPSAPKQTFAGVEFVANSNAPFLRVATRDASVMELDFHSLQWRQQTPWWDESLSSFAIQPSQGCCTASHPDDPRILAVGTMRGHVVLCRHGNRIVLDGSGHKTVQQMTWYNSSILLVYHVQAVRIWEFRGEPIPQVPNLEHSQSLARVTTYAAGEKAVVISAALNDARSMLVVGNSRGILFLFHVTKNNHDDAAAEDMTVLPFASRRLHRKEHVNDLRWMSNDRILSVGNDGHLCECRVENQTNLVELLRSPIRAFTGIDRILPPLTQCSKDSVLLGGYSGNQYILIDYKTFYEFFRTDTGGRARTLLFSLDADSKASNGQPLLSTITTPRKDGLNDLIVESQWIEHPESVRFTLGSNLHNETLFDIDLIRLGNGKLVMLSASEDCSSCISVWNRTLMGIENQALLPPQESGVRAICAKLLADDDSSMFVVEGGCKLLLRFYLIQVTKSSAIHSKFLGKGSPTENAAIDHRINAVDSFPMAKEGSTQFVISGDSNGHVFAYFVSVKGREQTSLQGALVFENPRPVLSLTILCCTLHFCYIVVGTSGGDVFVLSIPFSKTQIIADGSKIHHHLKAHSMGTNCLSALCVDSGTSVMNFRVCSGGDDQAISSFEIAIAPEEVEANARGNSTCTISTIASQQVSISAIRGISWLDDRHIAVSGYGQKLSVWELTENSDLVLRHVDDTEIGDVNSLASAISSDGEKAFIAIAGIGAQLYSVGS